MGRSVRPKVVRWSRGRKEHDRDEGPGKWFILCSRILPTNTLVNGREEFYRCEISDRWCVHL